MRIKTLTNGQKRPQAIVVNLLKRESNLCKRWWWSQTGSNRRPPACKAGALPAELWPRLDVLKQTPSGGSGGYAGPKPPQARVICQWLPSVNPFLTLWRTRSQVIADHQNQQPVAQSAYCLFSCFKQGPSYAASAAIASITASKVTWPFFTFSPLARCGSRSSAARP